MLVLCSVARIASTQPRPFVAPLLPLFGVQRMCFCSTYATRFNIKQYEMEKRKKRELERAGINEDDDDEPWIAPEEQQRVEEEQQLRDKEEADRVREMLERRAQEDIVKRKMFREFRAKQLAMSRQRKEAAAATKQRSRGNDRLLEEIIDDTSEDTSSHNSDSKIQGRTDNKTQQEDAPQ
uniref:Uncharacterized protein TCIL3000_10_8560 n=1 Tax=Trypanosoma congolense (strain IL3000) TaxID=1068625 RepID=G0UXG3_TRYCI|nr:unnamed protein product [Trypanosoma congolense IL3000]